MSRSPARAAAAAARAAAALSSAEVGADLMRRRRSRRTLGRAMAAWRAVARAGISARTAAMTRASSHAENSLRRRAWMRLVSYARGQFLILSLLMLCISFPSLPISLFVGGYFTWCVGVMSFCLPSLSLHTTGGRGKQIPDIAQRRSNAGFFCMCMHVGASQTLVSAHVFTRP